MKKNEKLTFKIVINNGVKYSFFMKFNNYIKYNGCRKMRYQNSAV